MRCATASAVSVLPTPESPDRSATRPRGAWSHAPAEAHGHAQAIAADQVLQPGGGQHRPPPAATRTCRLPRSWPCAPGEEARRRCGGRDVVHVTGTVCDGGDVGASHPGLVARASRRQLRSALAAPCAKRRPAPPGSAAGSMMRCGGRRPDGRRRCNRGGASSTTGAGRSAGGATRSVKLEQRMQRSRSSPGLSAQGRATGPRRLWTVRRRGQPFDRHCGRRRRAPIRCALGRRRGAADSAQARSATRPSPRPRPPDWRGRRRRRRARRPAAMQDAGQGAFEHRQQRRIRIEQTFGRR